MTDYKMTPEYARIITKMLNEKEPVKGREVNVFDIFPTYHERTFTTDSDMMKVFQSLKTESWARWFNFKDFAKVKWELDFLGKKRGIKGTV